MLGTPRLLGTETFDGRGCHIVGGTDFLGMSAELWIDVESFAVRKIHQHWTSPTVTVYRPEFDAELPDEVFEFEPTLPDKTPLDGEEVSKALRGLAGDPRQQAGPARK